MKQYNQGKCTSCRVSGKKLKRNFVKGLCHRCYNNKWYAGNKEDFKAYRKILNPPREYYCDVHERIYRVSCTPCTAKAYRLKHKQRLAEKRNEWVNKNKEKIKKWREKYWRYVQKPRRKELKEQKKWTTYDD